MKEKEAVGSGDDFFKAVMLSKKGKKILEQIIGQVLGKKVEIIEFINTELGKTQKIEKGKRIDVIVKIDGIIANVEVKLFKPLNGEKVITGTLKDLNDESIIIDDIEIPRKDISLIKIKFEW